MRIRNDSAQKRTSRIERCNFEWLIRLAERFGLAFAEPNRIYRNNKHLRAFGDSDESASLREGIRRNRIPPVPNPRPLTEDLT